MGDGSALGLAIPIVFYYPCSNYNVPKAYYLFHYGNRYLIILAILKYSFDI